MEPPLPVRVSSLGEVQHLIQVHGEDVGVRVIVEERINLLREGKGMVRLLRAKEDGKEWEVARLDKLEKVVEVHDALSKADALLTRLIARTDPAGRRVRGSVRIANIGFTSRGRRHDSAGRRVEGSVRIANPRGRRVGASFRVANLGSSSRRRRPDDSDGHRRAGRRHALPRIVPTEMAQDLLDAGNVLQRLRLVSVHALGEAVADAGLKLLRQKKDRTSLHALLLEVKDQFEVVWSANFRVNDL